MHCGKCAEAFLHTNNLFCHLNGVRILCIEAGNEGVGIAGLNHHHTKIVAFEHLVVGLFKGVSLALALVGKN